MPNFQTILWWLLAIVILVLGARYKIYQRSGKTGEHNTLRIIKKFLKNKNYKKQDYLLVNNLILQKKGYWSCEIDILLLTRKWIYVIEVKDWQVGMLRGNFNDEYLTRSRKIRKRRRHWQERVYSPFFQNETHIKRLKSYFSCSELNILSVIVFNGDMGYNLKRNKKLILKNKFVVTNHNKNRGVAEILASYERENTQLNSFEQLKEKIGQEITTPEKTRKHRNWVRSVRA